ncbi:MAG TPA: hypothetical protein VK507_11905 [Iamia sp.]|nr:hypothetical protein [Iamia sp.]
MPSTDDLFPDGLRDVRYGEVLLLSEDDGGYTAEVWNTLGLNDCPQEAWDALDAGAIAAERGALVALLNGPRRWTLDTIVPVATDAGERSLTRFGDLDMFLAATVELGDTLPDQASYVERRVARETIFRFKAGATIHQLTSRDRQRYVMQAYSHAVDPTQDLASLSDLESRLLLPEGWSFTTCVLDRTLDLLSTDGVATVVQDELQNTYQRIDAVSIAAMSGGA